MSEERTPALFELMKSPSQDQSGLVARALKVIRAHLGMPVAYVSEFVDNRSVFREVDAPGLEAMIKIGDSRSLDDVYCRHILAGRLPELIPDTSTVPFAQTLPITEALPIGAHLSVPIVLPDGSCYGMFCCLSFEPDQTLNERDRQTIKAFADLAAFEIGKDFEVRRVTEEKLERIRSVLNDAAFSMVYQPIVDIQNNRIVGVEALCRVAAEPARTPDLWFAEASDVGLRVDFELAALSEAVAALPQLPEDVFLSVNASPQTLLSPELAVVLNKDIGHRIVVEVTEQTPIDDYESIVQALAPLRDRGVRLAVDDAGAGYSSLQHIYRLMPEFIKFDTSLTRGVSADPVRQALISALLGFARKTGSRIVAEGVETAAELASLTELGVDLAQGYLLGRPAPIAALAGAAMPIAAPPPLLSLSPKVALGR